MKIGVIGSGPAAVAAATALVGSGHEVEMLDVGNEPEPQANDLAQRLRTGLIRDDDRRLLKSGFPENTPASTAFRLKKLGQVITRGILGRSSPDLNWKKIFGSSYVFKDIENMIPLTRSWSQTPRSLAKGGLSNVWGAACYPFSGPDFKDWPVRKADMIDHFRAVNELLQISEADDLLGEQYPVYGRQASPLKLNPQTKDLLRHWSESRDDLKRQGFCFGQARLAVLTQPRNSRKECQYCGLCLYGCPHGSIYSAAFTVEELKQVPKFRYMPGVFVHSFKESEGGKVVVHAHDVRTRNPVRLEYDKLLVGAGVLSTLRIVCESLGEYSRSSTLLDNHMLLVPLLKRSPWFPMDENVALTLSQLVLVLDNPSVCEERIHMQMYSYSDYIFDRFAALLAPMPSPVRRLIKRCLFNTLIMFAYLGGRHSPSLRARVIRQAGDHPALLDLKRVENPETGPAVRKLLRHLVRHRASLGFLAVTPALRKTDPGFSGHLCGSLPMKQTPGTLETHPSGLLHGCKSVYIVDQSTFPSLAAQNATYTAMANAHRIASQLRNEP